MNLKKRMTVGLPILILLAVSILASCGGNDIGPDNGLNKFSKLVEEEKLDDLSLTIYHIYPATLTRLPLSVDDLINYRNVNKVVVHGSSLVEHINLLKQLNKDVLKSVKNNSRIDARYYYVFETKKKGKIFDVAMWGGNDDYSIFVNGVEFQENDIFYNVIMPFLSEDGVEELNMYLGRWEAEEDKPVD